MKDVMSQLYSRIRQSINEFTMITLISHIYHLSTTASVVLVVVV